jgi:hypothetical protein
MRLCELPEFRDAIVTAKEYFNRPGLTEQFIEKDYYVTEALGTISDWRITAVNYQRVSTAMSQSLLRRISYMGRGSGYLRSNHRSTLNTICLRVILKLH